MALITDSCPHILTKASKMPLLQGCPKDSLASLEGAQNTRKAVVMCVKYRFPR